MTIEKLDGLFTVCKPLSDDDLILPRHFCFTARTDEELSLVCRTEDAPKRTAEREDGWRGFRIQGPLDFGLVGILARVSGVLAARSIPLFAVSTYDTDYVFVKSDRFDEALRALEAAGHQITEKRAPGI